LFQLLYDRSHNVLLTRLSGTYCEDDLALRDKQVAAFVARHGLARGLMDYSGVTAVDIPMGVIVRRCQAPPLLPGQTRVIVAPGEPSYSLNRVIVAHQYFSRKVEPLLLRSLPEAYHALGSNRLEFVPVEEDERMRRDRIAFGALAEIDAGARKQAERYRTLAAASRQRMAEVRGLSPAMVARGMSFITVGDLFNTALRHAQVSDRDLSIRCPGCRRERTLAACHILVSRRTTYGCPACGERLVELSQAQDRPAVEPLGYSFGDFELQTSANISCHGSVLPKSG
jgi:hypothetical protein